MPRQLHKGLPLEMRWRLPDKLPVAGEVEIAYVRFREDSTRVTVGPAQRTYPQPHPVLANVTTMVTVAGWEVLLNGESMGMQPVSFLDAVYAGLAVFVEAVPRMAQLLCREIAARAQAAGWDTERMEARVEYGGGGSQETLAGLADTRHEG